MISSWEYWPLRAFYWPLYPWFGYLALRHLHPCFFSATNPGIIAGGMGMESKFSTLQKIDAKWLPKTVFAKADMPHEALLAEIKKAGIQFPLIAKPDIGFRGLLVEKIRTPDALAAHLAPYPIDFLIQEYIDYPEEVGIYYHRFPGEKHGKITSFTLKEFLSVEGDGKHTVAELMQQDERAARQLTHFEEHQADLLRKIPPKGENWRVGEIGNHARGTTFLSGQHLIDNDLLSAIEELAKPIEGYYCGRFDLRCRSVEDLKKGQHYKVIELNGVCSEPTHMYDAQKMTYPQALLTLAKHWNIISKIARANRKRGIKYAPFSKMLEWIAQWKAYVKVTKS